MQPVLVTAAILRKGNRILITQRLPGGNHGGRWEFPGGKLEPGESPQQALRREIMEELGLAIEVNGIFEVVHHSYGTGSVLLLAYECRGEQTPIQHLEVADHRWVLPQELDGFDILPADLPIIRKLQAMADQASPMDNPGSSGARV